MRTHLFWMMAIALFLAACDQQPPPADEPEPTTSETVAQPEEPSPMVDQEFIEHMHQHAAKMDEIMFALADGDLDAAHTPAYWLGGHLSPDGIRAEWQPYLTGMREAALGVELATDLDTARAAAEQISVHCQGCHAAAGIATVN